MLPGGAASNQPNATVVAPANATVVAPESTAASESTAAASSLTTTTGPQAPAAAVRPTTPATPGAFAASPSSASTAAAAGVTPTAEGATAAALAPTVEASSTPASMASNTSELQQPLTTPSAPPRRAQVSPHTRRPAGPSKQSTSAQTDHRAIAAAIGHAELQAAASTPSPASAALATGAPQEPTPIGGSAVNGESMSEARIPTTATIAPAARATVGSASTPTVSSPAARSVLVSSADHSIYWALEDSGTIFRLTDQKSWQKQNSGVQSDLLAGQAVSNTVCWVVGRSGTILLTTDGTRWERIKSPTTADLVSVSAASADVADIVAADGSGFSTFDRGSNWQPSN